jgi:cation diffusion facilitator CzcD-associated flavoprotein CzcO
MSEETVDVVVVGAGFGGVYAAYRFREAGFSVVGLDGASGVGGVWYHNGYPGSRVDTESAHSYSYLFSQEIYDGWPWSERFAAQPELLKHLNWVADKLDVKRLFRFDNWVRKSTWSPKEQLWHVETDAGLRIACRYLVMCTGNLSEPKPLVFPGLERFKGEWVQSNRWPQRKVEFKGRRVAIIGTGSSGVQATPVVAEEAERLFVFQRTPHYAIPARNGGPETELAAKISADLAGYRHSLLWDPLLPAGVTDPKPAATWTPAEQQQILADFWEFGGHGLTYVFSDIGSNTESNAIVAEFVRDRIRERVKDPVLAEKLCPDYWIGTRRLILETDYYEAFNRDNVSLVDMRAAPIEELTETGIRTADGAHYDVDLIIFALGFKPFLGAIDKAGVVNEKGQTPGQVWARGPRTVMGLMTPGFPNLFHPANAGSPSVLSPLILTNEFHADWIADCIGHMKRHGLTTIEATEEGAVEWQRKCAVYADKMLRRQIDNYMVHVNKDDGTRIFLPWAGGMATYAPEVKRMTEAGYEGFRLGRAPATAEALAGPAEA